MCRDGEGGRADARDHGVGALEDGRAWWRSIRERRRRGGRGRRGRSGDWSARSCNVGLGPPALPVAAPWAAAVVLWCYQNSS